MTKLLSMFTMLPWIIARCNQKTLCQLKAYRDGTCIWAVTYLMISPFSSSCERKKKKKKKSSGKGSKEGVLW
jgi:hypothetical protein